MINQELLYEVLIEPTKSSVATTAQQLQTATMEAARGVAKRPSASPALRGAFHPAQRRRLAPHAHAHTAAHARRGLHTTAPTAALPVRYNLNPAPASLGHAPANLGDTFKAAFATTTSSAAPTPAAAQAPGALHAPKPLKPPAASAPAASASAPAISAVRRYASAAPGGGGAAKGAMVAVGAMAAVGFTYHTCPWFRGLFSCSHKDNKDNKGKK